MVLKTGLPNGMACSVWESFRFLFMITKMSAFGLLQTLFLTLLIEMTEIKLKVAYVSSQDVLTFTTLTASVRDFNQEDGASGKYGINVTCVFQVIQAWR